MTKQEEIIFLLQTYGIKQSWLAEKLGMKVNTLRYFLKESPFLEDTLYERIKEIIDNYRLEIELFNAYTDDEEDDLFSEEKLTLNIGARIRIFARKRYSTLTELANALEMKPQQLHQYISGKREPGAKILYKFLKLGCDINWLLGGAESVDSYRIYKIENQLHLHQEALKKIRKIIDELSK